MPTLALLDSGIVTAEFSEDGGSSWTEIVGVTNYSVTRNAAQQRDVQAFGNRTRSLAGASGTRTMTLEGIRPPRDPNWNRLEALSDQRTIVPQFRIRGQERIVAALTSAGNTAAIATGTGLVTLAGTPASFDKDEIEVGMSIKIGTELYDIKSITSAGVATVSPAPGANVTASPYSVVEGAAQRVIRGDIINAGQDSLAEGGELTDTITVNVQSITPWQDVA